MRGVRAGKCLRGGCWGGSGEGLPASGGGLGGEGVCGVKTAEVGVCSAAGCVHRGGGWGRGGGGHRER